MATDRSECEWADARVFVRAGTECSITLTKNLILLQLVSAVAEGDTIVEKPLQRPFQLGIHRSACSAGLLGWSDELGSCVWSWML